ncbi:hypothetical protein MMC08_003373 [Hypocenomyce scalaris]|nr:hypothetical protein [Hypocenomyce scalaris]
MLKSYHCLIITAGLAFLSLQPLLSIAASSSSSSPADDGDGATSPHDDDADHGATPLDELRRRWDYDWSFSGISTFAHLPYVKCLIHPEELFDIAVVGAPFDTAVSYRPGARFGPRAIRAASSRQSALRGFNHRRGLNPYTSWARILDCGDIPITPFSNALALQQMTSAFLELGSRPPSSSSSSSSRGRTRKPKLLTLGGDHSIALAALRALNTLHGGPVAVLHFDAHLDTWHPGASYPSAWTDPQSAFTHGSMLWLASQEGLILNGSSVHAGLRTRLTGSSAAADHGSDDRQGFLRIHADDIDDVPGGARGLADVISARLGATTPTYLSFDVDVLDPSVCPGTGTPEPGGWTSREVVRILRGLERVNVVGADIVEVAPAYDGAGEQTGLVAAQVAYEILTSWVGRELELGEAEGGGEAEGEGEQVGERKQAGLGNLGKKRDEL